MKPDILVEAVRSGNPKRIATAMTRIEKAEQAALRAEARRKKLLAAQITLNEQRLVQADRDRIAAADKAEADLRELGEPYAIIVYGGREYLVNLGVVEPLAAGTAQEAVRRIVFQIRQAWAEQIVGSRSAGHPVAPKDFWPEMATSGHGVLQAMRLELIAVRSAVAPAEEPAK